MTFLSETNPWPAKLTIERTKSGYHITRRQYGVNGTQVDDNVRNYAAIGVCDYLFYHMKIGEVKEFVLTNAPVEKLADSQDRESCSESCAGSSPVESIKRNG